MPHRLRDRHHPVLSMFYAPFLRIEELGVAPKLAAFFVGIVQVLWSDLFTYILLILLVAHATDWFFGRASAKREEMFDSDVSSWGLQSKIASVMQVLIIRSLEYALTAGSIVDTGGFAAVVVASALIYQDVDSIEGHRTVLGGRPIPVLSQVLRWMERMTSALIPDEPPTRPKDPGLQEETDP